MTTFASFGKFYPFSIPQRVVFVSFQPPRINLFRTHTPSLFYRPVEPLYPFASRNTRVLNSQQLLTKIFLACLFNNYYSHSSSSPFNAGNPREKFEYNHSSYTSEKTAPPRPMSAEEKSNSETQARAFKLLNIHGNASSDHAVLGVQENANKASIKKSYFSLSRKFHPDKYQGDDKPAATEAFRLVSEAYGRLTK